jgi:LPXTG-site transpeptidase (sortase) family protein
MTNLRRPLSITLGGGLVVAGVAVVLLPLLGVSNRGRADDSALSQWYQGGSSAVVGSAPNSAAPTCGFAGPSQSYALVTFPSLSQYGYAGVAGDGTWDLLEQRSMVHYQTTPAPGQTGNVIIGFHREPHFEHIDQLAAGDVVDLQDRACHTWHYRITQRWVLPPNRITQLGPTQDAELTLVTCTPWFQDYERIVWRGVLTDDARPAAPTAPGATSSPAAPISVPFLPPTPTPSPSRTSPAGRSNTPGPTQTPAPPSPTSSSTPTSAPTPAPTPTPTPAPTPTPTPAPTPTPTPAPTPTPTPAPTPTPTPAPTPTPTPAPTPTPTPKH